MRRLAFVLALLPLAALAQQGPAAPAATPPNLESSNTALGQEVMQLLNEKLALGAQAVTLQKEVDALKAELAAAKAKQPDAATPGTAPRQ